MRARIIARKTLREVWREPVMVVLTLVFAPAIVLLYLMVFPETAPTYGVVVVDQDGGPAAAEVRTALHGLRGAEGNAALEVSDAATVADAREAVADHEASVVVVLPEGFSARVAALASEADAQPVPYTVSGDLTSPTYLVAAVLTDAAVQQEVTALTGRSPLVDVTEEALGGSATRSEFEVYVPGLMVFAVIMLVFLSAMVVAREFESGGMRRLRLTRMSGADYVIGTSVVLAVLGAAAVALTFVTAWACGFRSQGPMWVAGLLLALATLSVIGVGLVTAAVTRTVVKAFVVANFPLAVLMFFSGAMFPMPRITWFTIAGHPMGPFELLPPTHAVTGLSKVVTMGAGLGEVLVELVALLVLTAASLGTGVWLLRRAASRPQA